MASTNKTANLGLNQWVLSDPFLMEDMNEDNKKIDEFVGKGAMVKLISVATAANAAQVDLNLSGIDMTKYAALKIEACYTCTPVSNMNNVFIRINNISTASYYHPSTPTSNECYSNTLASPYCSTSTSLPACFRVDLSGISGAPDSATTTRLVLGAVTFVGYVSNTPQMGTVLGSLAIAKGTAISSINIVANGAPGYIQAGSEFSVYGVRK